MGKKTALFFLLAIITIASIIALIVIINYIGSDPRSQTYVAAGSKGNGFNKLSDDKGLFTLVSKLNGVKKKDNDKVVLELQTKLQNGKYTKTSFVVYDSAAFLNYFAIEKIKNYSDGNGNGKIYTFKGQQDIYSELKKKEGKIAIFYIPTSKNAVVKYKESKNYISCNDSIVSYMQNQNQENSPNCIGDISEITIYDL